jgi:hypothetical protein
MTLWGHKNVAHTKYNILLYEPLCIAVPSTPRSSNEPFTFTANDEVLKALLILTNLLTILDLIMLASLSKSTDCPASAVLLQLPNCWVQMLSPASLFSLF